MTHHIDIGTLEIKELEKLAEVSSSPLTLQAAGQLATQEVEVDLGKPSPEQIDRVVARLVHLGEYGLLGAA